MINNAKFIKLICKAAIQDVGFRGPIKNNLEKNDLKGIIYNVEDGNVNIFIWGNDNIINNSLTQIQTEAKQKDILFEYKIEDLSVDISPPSGVFILEDTEKDKVRKFDKGLELLTVGNKHMDDIEKEIRHIKIVIEEALINIKQDKISSELDCNKVTIPKKGFQGIIIKTNNMHEKTEIVNMRSELDCVKIYDIKLILRYSNGQEPSDNVQITIRKQKTSDPSEPEAGLHVTTCKYEDLKRKFTPDKEIKLHFQESIALYLQKEYIQSGIQLEDIIFTADICTNIKKEKERKKLAKEFNMM